MRKRIILAVVILILAAGVAVGGWLAYKHAHPPKKELAPQKVSLKKREENHTKLFGNKIVVLINESIFGPKDVSIKANSGVQWTSMETATHQVVTDDGTTITAATSPELAQGQSYEFVFKKAGTYKYHDNLHPSMKGTVKVE